MRVQFHGAAGEVTGSMYLVVAAGKRILLDSGVTQSSSEGETHKRILFHSNLRNSMRWRSDMRISTMSGSVPLLAVS